MKVPYNSTTPRHWSNDPSAQGKKSLERNFLPIALPAPKKKEISQLLKEQPRREEVTEDRGDTAEIPIIDLTYMDEEFDIGTDAAPAKQEDEEEEPVAGEKNKINDDTRETEREQPEEPIVQSEPEHEETENCMANSAECFVTFKEDIEVGVAASLDCFAHGVNKLKELDFTPEKESKDEATVTSEETNIEKESNSGDPNDAGIIAATLNCFQTFTDDINYGISKVKEMTEKNEVSDLDVNGILEKVEEETIEDAGKQEAPAKEEEEEEEEVTPEAAEESETEQIENTSDIDESLKFALPPSSSEEKIAEEPVALSEEEEDEEEIAGFSEEEQEEEQKEEKTANVVQSVLERVSMIEKGLKDLEEDLKE